MAQESLHQKLKELAEQEGVSMNQFVTLAVSGKISVLLTAGYPKGDGGTGRLRDGERGAWSET